MDVQDITHKRSMLFSARMRFSSATQPIKDTAVGKIAEQILLLADDTGLTVQQMQQQSRVGAESAAMTEPGPLGAQLVDCGILKHSK